MSPEQPLPVTLCLLSRTKVFLLFFLKNFFFVLCGPFFKSLLNFLQYCFCSMLWFSGYKAHGILVPWPGVEPTLPAMEGEVSTTGSPGKSFLFSHSLSSPLSLWLYLSLSLKNTQCAYMLSYFSHVRLFATPWTAARQAPLSIGFSRQEYWSGVPCPPPGNLPDPGIKPASFYVSCIGREVLYHLVPPGKCPLLPTKKNHTHTEKHTNAAANLYILNTYLLCTFRGTTYSFKWWFIIIYKLFIY